METIEKRVCVCGSRDSKCAWISVDQYKLIKAISSVSLLLPLTGLKRDNVLLLLVITGVFLLLFRFQTVRCKHAAAPKRRAAVFNPSLISHIRVTSVFSLIIMEEEERSTSTFLEKEAHPFSLGRTLHTGMQVLLSATGGQCWAMGLT